MKSYNATLLAVAEDGTTFVVATGVTVVGASEDHARHITIGDYWDPRLEAASCSPVVVLHPRKY